MADDTETDARRGTHAEKIGGDPDLPSEPGELATDLATDEQDLFVPPGELALSMPVDVPNIQAAEKRDRGRPKGSKNRKDADLLQYLMARGYHSPLEAGAALYNMNAEDLALQISRWRVELQQELLSDGTMSEDEINQLLIKAPLDPWEVLKLQATVMAAHLPYWHSKMTPDETPPDGKRPLMIINQLNVTQVNKTGGMSAGFDPNANVVENQQLDDDEDVRLPK